MASHTTSIDPSAVASGNPALAGSGLIGRFHTSGLACGLLHAGREFLTFGSATMEPVQPAHPAATGRLPDPAAFQRIMSVHQDAAPTGFSTLHSAIAAPPTQGRGSLKAAGELVR